MEINQRLCRPRKQKIMTLMILLWRAKTINKNWKIDTTMHACWL